MNDDERIEQVEIETRKATLREVIELAKLYHFDRHAHCGCVCHRVGTRLEGIGSKVCSHCFYEQIKLLVADA